MVANGEKDVREPAFDGAQRRLESLDVVRYVTSEEQRRVWVPWQLLATVGA